MCAYVTYNNERKKRWIYKVPSPLEEGKKGWKVEGGGERKESERVTVKERSFRYIPSVSSDKSVIAKDNQQIPQRTF